MDETGGGEGVYVYQGLVQMNLPPLANLTPRNPGSILLPQC